MPCRWWINTTEGAITLEEAVLDPCGIRREDAGVVPAKLVLCLRSSHKVGSSALPLGFNLYLLA